MSYRMHLDTPFGRWCVEASETGLTAIMNHISDQPDCPNEICQSACAQLLEYFQCRRQQFHLPMDLIGTPFQKQVWERLLQVPFGSSLSYGALALEIGKPSAVRAVAQAVGRNPCLIVVPCHRILGKDGSLTGFSAGLELKRGLLRLEQIAWKE